MNSLLLRLILLAPALVMTIETTVLSAPNDQPPTINDRPESKLKIKWTDLYTSAEVYIPKKQFHQECRIQGDITLAKNEPLVLGVAVWAEVLQVLDETGKDILSKPIAHRGSYHEFRYSYGKQWEMGSRAQLELTRIPTHIILIRGNVYALVAKRVKVFEFDVNKPTDWVKLAPQMQIKFSKIEIKRGGAEIRWQVKSEDESQFPQYMKVEEKGFFKHPIAFKYVLEEKNGRKLDYNNLMTQGGRRNKIYEGKGYTVTSWTPGPKYTKLKVFVAFETEQRAVPFEIKDIPFSIYSAVKRNAPK